MLKTRFTMLRAMTRCECAELSFDELARRLREAGRSFDQLQAETGVGLLCTACLPELRAHLARAGVAVAEAPLLVPGREPR